MSDEKKSEGWNDNVELTAYFFAKGMDKVIDKYEGKESMIATILGFGSAAAAVAVRITGAQTEVNVQNMIENLIKKSGVNKDGSKK